MAEGTNETLVRAGEIPTELLHISRRNPNYVLLFVQQRTGHDIAAAVVSGRSISDAERELLDKAREFQKNPAAEDMTRVLFANYADRFAARSAYEEGLRGGTGPEISRRAYLTYASLLSKFRKGRLQNR